MMCPDPKSPETIFGEAIAIESPEDRAAFLDQACQDDPELRRELEKLVMDHFRAGDFLENPAVPDATIGQPITEGPGTVIGPYKLLQQIGEGGMGVVYLADQREPIKRRVALKIIKPGMPYFVMELVNGIPITTYCDQQRLTTSERLDLFIPICQAIQHAQGVHSLVGRKRGDRPPSPRSL
ncbi:MAG: hypothetical protein ACYTG0_20215 [Planctomycetota bacterium]|jgi:serine/threonine protein kinase